MFTGRFPFENMDELEVKNNGSSKIQNLDILSKFLI